MLTKNKNLATLSSTEKLAAYTPQKGELNVFEGITIVYSCGHTPKFLAFSRSGATVRPDGEHDTPCFMVRADVKNGTHTINAPCPDCYDKIREENHKKWEAEEILRRQREAGERSRVICTVPYYDNDNTRYTDEEGNARSVSFEHLESLLRDFILVSCKKPRDYCDGVEVSTYKNSRGECLTLERYHYDGEYGDTPEYTLKSGMNPQ